ncbi:MULTISPECIES: arsenate reductase family protein [unclassified Paenibacillus]|uniref:arsenate reductase family protein n=1 Tax=unclassified Paenibacillus TaxID=185978 RepID=UPI002405F30B|nr:MULTISPECIES: arsenate reductase family protein [unclassified Paenibacillus]MDF9844242.1 arsenate reductase [Paenibacillus sp. PastF-2]MDF9850847.1 arsenate reductase [Paenibacillus sp. PastM-2]MDF9857390.1 arsenate reductase [Paenibacillus sp. PastF-1]MDH6482658.1 arsenate reductase [Paenibacillus sp. PastH-2]MDH6510112.1 arsenate reductase [Paenibacillus sp. PastM-3]
MSHLKVYQYPKCSTCRSAVKWLKEQGHELELQHIAEQPPTVEELRVLVANSGLPLKKFFNTSGEVYKELGLKDKLAGLSEDDQLELLAAHGMLIKRPVVTDGKKVTVGFKAEQYADAWSSAE